jgi:DNA-binding NarL/FixJ family response regulator
LEATKLIKKERPATQIVIITQHDSSQVRSIALQAGASSFVTKSAVGSELVVAIMDLLKHSEE